VQSFLILKHILLFLFTNIDKQGVICYT